MSKDIPVKQRALVLQGGGALGAYEAGVLKSLYRHLTKEDKENEEEKKLLFDIVAGSSIGAINSTILVSEFLKTGSWIDAILHLVKFWKDKRKGLALDPPDIKLEDKFWLKDKWYKETLGVASKETARRYYSSKDFLLKGARKFFTPLFPPRSDYRFFDNESDLTKWVIYSNEPLKETIQYFANFPITTNFEKNEPRLLVFAVDVAEGELVTFDSHPKEDGSRRSEYGQFRKDRGYKYVINYQGITIDHVMASATIPEFYDYAEIPVNEVWNDDKSIHNNENKNHQNVCKHYFWDSGVLSNTPLKEVLQAHQNYWGNRGARIPDLDIYIVNVHPRKINYSMIPKYYDGVKDRHNDLKYCDRYSHYDEKIMHLITDYRNCVIKMNNLIRNFTQDSNDKEELQKVKKQLLLKFENILESNTISKDYYDGKEFIPKRYEDLISYGFMLNKVIRIERSNYVNSISGKGADSTYETISKLVIEGECDAFVSFINEEINNIKLHFKIDNNTQSSINEILDKIINLVNNIMDNLKNNNFENPKEAYNRLSEIINEINKNRQMDKIQRDQFYRIIDYLEDFKEILQNIEDCAI